MGHPGLEPGTNRLKAEYSTIELVTLQKQYLHDFSFFIKGIQVEKLNCLYIQ